MARDSLTIYAALAYGFTVVMGLLSAALWVVVLSG